MLPHSAALLPFQREILLQAAFGVREEEIETGESELGLMDAEPPRAREGGQLFILAKGLGLGTLISICMDLFASAPLGNGVPTESDQGSTSLVLLLNTPAKELEELYNAPPTPLSSPVNMYDSKGKAPTPKTQNPAKRRIIVLNNETSIAQRQQIYRSGGLIAVTSRILIVDMLNAILPIPLITGILVNNAHEVRNVEAEGGSGMDSFILKVFRRENKHGFICAFSDDPEACHSTAGGGLVRLMKTLRVRRASLWPRFHLQVQEDIKAGGPVQLAEHRVSLTTRMKDIQSGLVECIAECIKELKRLNPGTDWQEMSVENVIASHHFTRLVRSFVGNISLSTRSKHIVADIKQLASLLKYLVSYDCVSFYALLKAILAASAPGVTDSVALRSDPIQSPWLLLDAAQVVFRLAKERVYTTQNGAISLVLEIQPKLARCVDLILKCGERGPSQGPILVMVNGDRSVRQLKEMLKQRLYEKACKPGTGGDESFASPQHLLRKLFKAYSSWNEGLGNLATKADERSSKETATSSKTTTNQPPSSKRRRVRGSALPISSNVTPASSGLMDLGEVANSQLEEILSQIEATENSAINDEDAIFCIDDTETEDLKLGEETADITADESKPRIVIQPYSSSSVRSAGTFGTAEHDSQILEQLCPRHVILFDSDLAFVRRLELFKAMKGPSYELNVVFFVYDNSVEEQRYLSAIRREKRAFEQMIDIRKGMVIPIEADFNPKDGVSFWKRHTIMSQGVHSSNGLQIVNDLEPPTIVVDVREFRSPLPGVLDDQGFLLKPCTLEVGDFVLAPSVVVERKSMSDLIGSLRSGRLFSQCSNMLKWYKIVVLLIEWEAVALGTRSSTSSGVFYRSPVAPYATLLNKSASFGQNDDDVLGKLVLLCLHFPSLRLLWSHEPATSGLLFADLKAALPEPVMEQAIAIGSASAIGECEKASGKDASTSAPIGASGWTAMEMLRRVPGVNDGNISRITRQVKSLRALSQLNLKRCQEVSGGEEFGKRIYQFFHGGGSTNVVQVVV